MRLNEFDSGYISMFEDLSPEVVRAQRLAELEQMARYRALRLAQYQAWANEDTRADIRAHYMVDEAAARATWRPEKEEPKLMRLEDRITIREIHRPRQKVSWWRRIFRR